MKAIFNDAVELTIQKAYIDSSGALRMKTISATQEQLRALCEDTVKTAKITIEEMGKIQAVYEGYTRYDGTMVYAGGILEPCLYKVGETPAERLNATEAAVVQTQTDMQMAVAELTMVIAALTDALTGGGDGSV